MTGTSVTSNTKESPCSKVHPQTNPKRSGSKERQQTASVQPRSQPATPRQNGKPRAPSSSSDGASIPQHLEALARANAIRFRRADLKRGLKDGSVTILEVIQDPATANAYLIEVLQWQVRWGVTRTNKVLNALLAYDPKCGNLTSRQIGILTRLLG